MGPDLQQINLRSTLIFSLQSHVPQKRFEVVLDPFGKVLRSKLEERRGLLVPGAADALSARVIASMGFEAIYITGAGVTNALLGMPDLGFISLPELAQQTSAIREAAELPIIVDADTGFGNALNVRHTIQVLERAGANAIQIEDQIFPKRCGHFSGKQVIAVEEMVAKIKAATDARRSQDFLIIARTDARAQHGFQAAIDRAATFIQAGADVTFVEAPQLCCEFPSSSTWCPAEKRRSWMRRRSPPWALPLCCMQMPHCREPLRGCRLRCRN
jgi:2-methylisocitrate lyase-like PEP mutase family enzyme